MERIAIKLDPSEPYQAQTITINPDGRTVTLRLEIRYMVYLDKWFLSIYNAADSTCLITYVPIVSSETIINDLLGLFGYLAVGSVGCFPVSMQQYGTDPAKDTLNLFEIQWGDRLD